MVGLKICEKWKDTYSDKSYLKKSKKTRGGENGKIPVDFR